MRDSQTLRAHLDALLESTDWEGTRDRDPVGLVWEYPNATDREVVGLVVASLAYGRVSMIRHAARRALRPLGSAPARALIEGDFDRLAVEEFVYRMTRGRDVLALFDAIGATLRAHGSLEGLFVTGLSAGAPDARDAMTRWVAALRDCADFDSRGFRYLLPDPSKGGACKRLNLYLRWMVRGPDRIDLGLWRHVSPAILTIPLDTHIARMSDLLGLASRKTQDWKLARQITDALRELDPDDPLKYDFAVCHLGISGACPRRRDEEICRECSIRPLCRISGTRT